MRKTTGRALQDLQAASNRETCLASQRSRPAGVRTPRMIGYSDLKTRSTIHPKPTSTTRLNRMSASTPNASSILCLALRGSPASFFSCSTDHSPSVLPFSTSASGCLGVIRSSWIAASTSSAPRAATRLSYGACDFPYHESQHFSRVWDRRHVRASRKTAAVPIRLTPFEH